MNKPTTTAPTCRSGSTAVALTTVELMAVLRWMVVR